MLEGDARLLLARASRMAGDLDSARREAAAASRIFEQEKPTSSASRARWCSQPKPRGRRASRTLAQWLEQGPGRRPQHPRHRQPGRLLSLAITRSNLVGEYEQANALLEEAARLDTDAPDAASEDRIPTGGRWSSRRPTRSTPSSRCHEIIEESEIGGTVYETLLTTDTNGHLLPWLCEKWDLSITAAGAS